MVKKSLQPRAARRKSPSKKLPPGVVEKSGRWYVRIRYREGGKRHAAWRECAKNPTDAKDVLKALRRELEDHGHESLRHAQMTFDELAKHFEDNYLQPAKFINGRKVSGRRSVKPVQASLKPLKAFFAHQPVRSITHGHLESYKRLRLDTPVVFEKTVRRRSVTTVQKTSRQRSIATVNREMQVLRHLLAIAIQEGWLHRNPFARGDSLISAADEKERQRILTSKEEARLLALCVGRRAHLRPRIVCAIDTGMRWGEMTKTRVCDVDLDARVITIEATHTKTLKTRRVKLSARLVEELRPLCADKEPTDRVFEYATVKTAWTGLRKDALLPDVRWHDLRHTNATRIEATKRASMGQLGRHLGHSNPKTTYRYVNQDDEAINEIAKVVEEFNVAAQAKEKSETVH
jgi:integrase